jgi:hypothetical protein
LNGLQGTDCLLPPGTQVGNTVYWDGSNWIVSSNHLFNNGTNVSIGTTSVENSAIFNVSSNSKGILIPRMTQSERNLISNPATGLFIFQIDNNPGFYYFDGSNWVGILNTNSSNSSSNTNSLIYTVNGF